MLCSDCLHSIYSHFVPLLIPHTTYYYCWFFWPGLEWSGSGVHPLCDEFWLLYPHSIFSVITQSSSPYWGLNPLNGKLRLHFPLHHDNDTAPLDLSGFILPSHVSKTLRCLNFFTWGIDPDCYKYCFTESHEEGQLEIDWQDWSSFIQMHKVHQAFIF